MFRKAPAATAVAGYLLLLACFLLLSCSGTTKSVSANPSPAPTPSPSPSPTPAPTPSPTPSPAPTPTPTPSPTPTPTPTPPPSPTPSPSSAPDSYLAQIVDDIPKVPTLVGQVSVDTTTNDGSGNARINGWERNQAMVLQFCPFPQREQNCVNVTSFSTDAQGNADVTFAFPQKGAFSGMFQFTCDGQQCLVTGTGSSGVNFKSAELPASSISGGINQTTGSAPGIGALVVNGTMAHLTLTATTPNHTFNVAICPMFPDTPCQQLSNVSTDAQGNASADVGNIQPAGWNVFTVSDSAGVEFVSGFRVE